ncbi:MAG: vitamin K epoxide reductase family protein [Synechococcales bacterium]|nr:vitamin K epoxide reductase family protein [Synechococcales bacterium]
MIRRRSAPWIHRWSRPLLGGIATLGVINTAYLTYLRWFGEAVCPTQTCAVLASRYATIFEQPLSLWGFLAYLGMAILALAPLLASGENQKSLRSSLEEKTWLLLFVGATGMLLFSGYLMYIMFTEFMFGGQNLGWAGLCPFCLFSAICALAMFVLVMLGREWDDRGLLVMLGSITGIATLVTSLAVYAPQPVAEGQYAITNGAEKPFFYLSDSAGEAEKELARHLKQSGAMLYTAYTCPHCCEQKQLFGIEALPDLPNTECNPTGKDPQTELCQKELQAAAVQTKQEPGFPTWKINGKYLFGVQKLEELANLSGYQGDRNFKNQFKACKPA